MRRDRESTDLTGAAYLAARDALPAEVDLPDRRDISDITNDPTEDPMFNILRLARQGQEELARQAYGDRTVDAAIGRVLLEEGFE